MPGAARTRETVHQGFREIVDEDNGKKVDFDGMTMLPAGKIVPNPEVLKFEGDDNGNLVLVGKIPPKEPNLTPSSVQASSTKAPGGGKTRAKRGPFPSDPGCVEMVTYRGAFGSMTVPYKYAIAARNALILGQDKGIVSYSPPETEDGFEVEFSGNTFKAWSLGISFRIPGVDDNITVLLKE